jgi:hypothetical protein
MAPHTGDQVGYTGPIVSNSENPLEYGMRDVEFIVERLASHVSFPGRTSSTLLNTYLLIVPTGNFLARHQAFLRHENTSIGIKRGCSEHDMLSTICKLSPSTLDEEEENHADDACGKGLGKY